jgi:hypothetical protein
MTELVKYAPGTPCWVELWTPDREASMSFYAGAFGWEYRVAPAEQHFFTEALVGGRTVAGLMTPPGDGDNPMVWVTYLATDDLAAALAAVTAHGGQSMTGAIDVPDQDGIRIAVAADPDGNLFGLMTGTGQQGAQLANVPGAQIWNELMTADPAAVRPFYAAVFGVEVSDPISPDFDYTTIRSGGRDVGGIGPSDDARPAGWGTYFAVVDTDASAAAVLAAGGKVLAEPMDTPYGRMAACADPHGTAFYLMGTSA